MKIINSISSIYYDRKPLLEKLKTEVDTTIRSGKRESWHYESRIKSVDSFALKIETGRVEIPMELEDFFACTLVVENLKEITKAIEFIERYFVIENKRPPDGVVTLKESYSFRFDDLRLYVTLKKEETLPPNSISDILFEIQIKTFLQHAWSIATHDLIYKSDNISWPKERVAYQIKAMLEQAEISISGAEVLSKLPEVNKENKESKTLNEINKILKESFPSTTLPADLLRLSRIVNDLLSIFRIDPLTLKGYIEAETKMKRGAETLNLSPYCIIIQSIINQNPDLFEKTVNSKNRSKKFLLPSEISLNSIIIKNESNIIKI